MTEFCELWQGGPVFAQAKHFRLSTDSVLLADFVNTSGLKRGIDLGCASGIVSLLLLAKEPSLHMTGLELLPEAAELAGENMGQNALEARCDIVKGDIRRHRELFSAGSFDLVVANPPYFPADSGCKSPDPARAAARAELSCSMEDICAAAAYLCRNGGSFCLVHKPERLSRLLCGMSGVGIEPKRLRMVCHRWDSPPSLVLVEGRRGGRPGLKAEASLILTDRDGGESEEYRRIYHR